MDIFKESDDVNMCNDLSLLKQIPNLTNVVVNVDISEQLLRLTRGLLKALCCEKEKWILSNVSEDDLYTFTKMIS